MYEIHGYSTLLAAALQQATRMVHALPAGYHLAAGHDVLNFLRGYGCIGYPSGQPDQFTLGPWLKRPGTPAHQHAAITIIPCFSDDIAPFSPPDPSYAAYCFASDQLILIYAAEQWSPAELALLLFHEGRHARHRLGPKLAELPPLDRDELHETNTWLATLNLLSSWGGAAWVTALRCEIDWLAAHALTVTGPREIKYVASKQYWPALDDLFGATSHALVRRVRQSLVTLAANIEYWSDRNPALLLEQICHSALAEFYR